MANKSYKDRITGFMMEKWVTTGKKGQVTLFVIVAIVIVGLIALVVMFYPRVSEFVSPGAFSPSEYLRSCITPEVSPAMQALSAHGGYLEPEGFVLYNGEKIKYLCYTSENYQTCTVQEPLIVDSFQRELNNIIKPKAQACANNLKSEYEKRGYIVFLRESNFSLEVSYKKIKMAFVAPMTITKGDQTQKFERFDVESDSEMYDLLSIAQSIVGFESTYGDSETTAYMQYYPDLKIEKNKISDGSKIYTLSNVVTKESFVFASRSLVWPPGYGLS